MATSIPSHMCLQLVLDTIQLPEEDRNFVMAMYRSDDDLEKENPGLANVHYTEFLSLFDSNYKNCKFRWVYRSHHEYVFSLFQIHINEIISKITNFIKLKSSHQVFEDWSKSVLYDQALIIEIIKDQVILYTVQGASGEHDSKFQEETVFLNRHLRFKKCYSIEVNKPLAL